MEYNTNLVASSALLLRIMSPGTIEYIGLHTVRGGDPEERVGQVFKKKDPKNFPRAPARVNVGPTVLNCLPTCQTTSPSLYTANEKT